LRKVSLIAVIVLFSFSCNNPKNSKETLSPFIDTAKGFKKDYFNKNNGKPIYWLQYCKDMAKSLGLDTLQNGASNLEIRIWYEFSRYSEKKLVIIRNKGFDWIAKVYRFDEERANEFKNISIKQPNPKSGWKEFMNQLFANKILTLPRSSDLPEYPVGADGFDYIIEIATSSQYRLYDYWEPMEYEKQLPEAKNMSSILKTLEKELDVIPVPKKYTSD